MVTNNAPADRVVAIHRRLDVGHSLPLRRKGKYFFLDIPFYRTGGWMSDTRFPSGGRGSIFSLTSPFIEPRLWLSREMPRAADALVVPALCLESTAPNLINCGSV
jgi:hypothetical protein